MKPTVIGTHHKTGTVLAIGLTELLVSFLPERPGGAPPIAVFPNALRKVALSSVLRQMPRAPLFSSLWCEHRIDAPDINLVHFVRGPLSRIASGYLYHKRGAPSDAMGWVHWKIFDFHGPKSYMEVVNALDVQDALIVEAIRTYPEAAGSKRAFESAAKLPARQSLPVWLHAFEESPDEALTAIFRMVAGEDDARLEEFLAGARTRGIVLDRRSAPPGGGHVTRNDADRRTVDHAVAQSAEIAHLYEDIARAMAAGGPGRESGAASVRKEPVGTADCFDILDEIKARTMYLVVSPNELQAMKEFWHDAVAGSIWQTFALSNFANGHLMMQPFIQRFLSRLR